MSCMNKLYMFISMLGSKGPAISHSFRYNEQHHRYNWGLSRQKQVSQSWINDCIPQNTVGCNYLLMPEIPAYDAKVLNCVLILNPKWIMDRKLSINWKIIDQNTNCFVLKHGNCYVMFDLFSIEMKCFMRWPNKITCRNMHICAAKQLFVWACLYWEPVCCGLFVSKSNAISKYRWTNNAVKTVISYSRAMGVCYLWYEKTTTSNIGINYKLGLHLL